MALVEARGLVKVYRMGRSEVWALVNYAIIRLAPSDPELRWGMTTKVEFLP